MTSLNPSISQRPTLAEVQTAILESDDDYWKLVTTGSDEVAVYKLDVNLRLIVCDDESGIQNDDFKAEWANSFPNEKAVGYFVDIFYGATILHRAILVAVDGHRAMLPLPRSGDKELIANAFDCKLAEIFDSNLSSLTEYMAQARISVASDDNGGMLDA